MDALRRFTDWTHADDQRFAWIRGVLVWAGLIMVLAAALSAASQGAEPSHHLIGPLVVWQEAG